MKTLFIIAAIITSLQCYSQQYYDTIPAQASFSSEKLFDSLIVINGQYYEVTGRDTVLIPGNPIVVNDHTGGAVQIIGDTSYTKWLITIYNFRGKPIQVKAFQRCIIGKPCDYVDQRKQPTIGRVKILSFTQNGW